MATREVTSRPGLETQPPEPIHSWTGNGFGIASAVCLVLSLLSFGVVFLLWEFSVVEAGAALAFVPLGWAALGFCFGVVGLFHDRRLDFAIVGLGLNLVAVAFMALMLVFWVFGSFIVS